ncbi:MAG: alpha/beta fold hydrolase [Pirellulales bacterium]
MPYWPHDGLQFRYREVGGGLPFVFQHGLGGDVNQPLSLFVPPPGIRALSLDTRGHGLTMPLGPEEKIGIAQSADDLVAWLDYLRVARVVVGGISMGAAIALNVTLRYPERVMGLVLSRPAWLDGPMQHIADLFGQVARLIREAGPDEGYRLYQQTDEYRQMLAESPDCAAGLLAQFQHHRAAETVCKLERIPRDAPCHDLNQLAAIAVPTLILANLQDPIHPFTYGQALAERIPHAEFRELTPKSISLDRYAAETQRHLVEFLTQNFL